jgi:rhodanese-related sulfurtransferase
MEPTKISVADAKKKLDQGTHPLFIDTRNPNAWQSSHEKLPGARRIPVDMITQEGQNLPQDRELITYCT